MRVTGDDYARLSDHAEASTWFVGNRCYMRMAEGHCAALVVEPDGRFACSVYELRPECCRALARDSDACAGERAAKLDRPARALVLVREQSARCTRASDK